MRGAVAILAFLGGPAGTAWLLAHGRIPQAGIAVVGILGYAAVEVALFYRRDRAKSRAAYRSERAAAGPVLGDYTPQTEDRYYTEVELPNGRIA